MERNPNSNLNPRVGIHPLSLCACEFLFIFVECREEKVESREDGELEFSLSLSLSLNRSFYSPSLSCRAWLDKRR